MIEKAIENWLISTNERNYQAALCQVLMRQGHSVLHSSSHGPMEQGKDIITLDADGGYCAYQTKTGDIGLSEWRQIRGEIEELAEIPISYPGVDKTQQHKAFLVTNGNITDPVRREIDDRNEDNIRKGRNYAFVSCIAKDALLKQFIDAQGRFIPRELPEMQAFLGLYLKDGASPLPKADFFSILESICFGKEPAKKSDRVDALTSSVVIVSYLLNPFERASNYFAMSEGWGALASSIARYVAKFEVPEREWRPTFDLVMNEVSANLNALAEESASRPDFLEGDARADGGILLYARTTIVLGALSYNQLSGNQSKSIDDSKLMSLISAHIDRLWFWGESAFPYFFHLVKFLERVDQVSLAQEILEQVFCDLVYANKDKQAQAFAHPYYEVEKVLSAHLIDADERTRHEGCKGSSYIIRSVLEMLIRRGRRDVVADQWRNFTYCQQLEFIPDKDEDIFAWRAKNGLNGSAFPKQTQSWTELQAITDAPSSKSAMFDLFPGLLPLHIMVCPHRVTPEVVSYLDRAARPLFRPQKF